MRNKYFQFIEIEKPIIKTFIEKHSEMKKFVSIDEPFYLRIYKKPFSGLLHIIFGQNESNDKTICMWNELLKKIKKVSPKNIFKCDLNLLENIVGKQKAKLLKEIASSILKKEINLKKIKILSEEQIINILCKFENLTINSIKTFLIFVAFKKNVLCNEDQDFLVGLKLFLNKKFISENDINSIKIKYKDDLTLFSVCMWKIRNQSVKKI